MNMKSRLILMILAVVATTAACEKNAVQIIDDPEAGGGNVKFFNFAVGAPGVNFYVNDKKVTAISSTLCAVLDDTNRAECTAAGREATTGVVYGSSGHGVNAWYSDVPTGQVTMSGRIAAATDKNLAIANLPTTVEQGKFYSYYLSGIYNTTTKTSDAFIVEDVLPPTPTNFDVAYVRFVNASSTTQPMTLTATHATTAQEVTIGGAVAYKSAGAFVAVPEGTYNLVTRNTGSTTNVFTRTGVAFNGGRVYTIAARGNTATASTMALDNTANR